MIGDRVAVVRAYVDLRNAALNDEGANHVGRSKRHFCCSNILYTLHSKEGYRGTLCAAINFTNISSTHIALLSFRSVQDMRKGIERDIAREKQARERIARERAENARAQG